MSVLRHGFADGTPKHNSCTRDEWRSLLALQSCRSRILLAQAWARQLNGNSLRRSKTVACTLCHGMLLLLHVVALLRVAARLSPSLRLPLFLRPLPPFAELHLLRQPAGTCLPRPSLLQSGREQSFCKAWLRCTLALSCCRLTQGRRACCAVRSDCSCPAWYGRAALFHNLCRPSRLSDTAMLPRACE